MEEYRLLTDSGFMKVAAESYAEAVRLAESDGHVVRGREDVVSFEVFKLAGDRVYLLPDANRLFRLWELKFTPERVVGEFCKKKLD